MFSFLASYRAYKGIGIPRGSKGSKNYFWKIFYRADSEIGTPGTPRGARKGPRIFFEEICQENSLGYMKSGLGAVTVKTDFWPKKMGIKGYVSRKP